MRYTQRLADAGAVASVGSAGDSYDNTLAEAFKLVKDELVRSKGPWSGIDHLELAVAEYLDWYNHRRLHGEIGTVSPVESEDNHYPHDPAPATVGASFRASTNSVRDSARRERVRPVRLTSRCIHHLSTKADSRGLGVLLQLERFGP